MISSPPYWREFLARARRHLSRLEQLAEDQDARQEYRPLTMHAREQLDYIRQELDWRS